MAAAVSPQTASSHLSQLLTGGLVASESKGRQRLFHLKNRDVVIAIEALGALAHVSPASVMPEMRFARSCYDHLAGVLAIALRNELLRRGALRHHNDALTVTPVGNRFLQTLDIDVGLLRGLRRSFAYKCLDWAERHHHVGGAVGAALLSRFLEMDWLARVHGTRAVRVTHAEYAGSKTRLVFAVQPCERDPDSTHMTCYSEFGSDHFRVADCTPGDTGSPFECSPAYREHALDNVPESRFAHPDPSSGAHRLITE